MTAATCKKLKRLGYDEDFIKSIICFRKNSSKRFIFRVTDIQDLSQSPKDGEFICYASFSTLEELDEIIEKLEGFAYAVMDTTESNPIFKDGGIIDDCVYYIYEEIIPLEDRKMKKYKFAVSICGGWCSGILDIEATNEDKAYAKAYEYVNKKWCEAFPTLEIDYYVECEGVEDIEGS